MKNYEEFINEDIIDFGRNDIKPPKGMEDYHKDLLTLLKHVKDKIDKKAESKQDDFGEYILNVYTMDSNNVAKALNRKNTSVPIEVYISTLPPHDIDDFLDFYEELKDSVDFKNYMNIDHYDNEIKVIVKIPLKWIDENVLKSIKGINKYDL